jgi:Flp pilus assembly protein CpaB
MNKKHFIIITVVVTVVGAAAVILYKKFKNHPEVKKVIEKVTGSK